MADSSKFPIKGNSAKKRREDQRENTATGASAAPRPREIAPLPDATRELAERKLEKKLSLSDITLKDRESSGGGISGRSEGSPTFPAEWPRPSPPPFLIDSSLKDQAMEVCRSVADRTVSAWLDTRGPAIVQAWLSENVSKFIKIEKTADNKRRKQEVDSPVSSMFSDDPPSPLSSSSPSSSPQLEERGDSADPRKILRQKFLAENSLQQVKGPVQALRQDTGLVEAGELQQGPHAAANVAQLHQSPESSSARARKPGGSSGAASSPDLLLVEDVRVSQKLFQTLLSRAQYRVEVASDGESAVEIYQRDYSSLRVILMDIHMPGIDGMEATQRIRKFEHELNLPPVLVYGLTGDVAVENLREYEQAGMNGCIVKGKLLVEALKEALEMSDREPTRFVNLAGESAGDRPSGGFSRSQLSSRASAVDEEMPQASNSPSLSDSHMDSPGSLSQSASPSQLPAAIFSLSMGSIPAPRLTLPYQPGALNGPDCLLVEDVRVSQRIAKSSLERAGFKVEVASSGEEAIQKFRSHSSTIRVILMDIGLPGLSGIEATEEIRSMENDRDGPVLIFGLTGNTESENLREYEQVGMNGCIAKGKLINEAVKRGIEASVRKPGVFINLAGQTDENNNEEEKTKQPATTSASSPQAINERFSNLRQNDAAAAPPESLIGTPRAPQPRQLLNSKFTGRGTVKPGIGLPSASSAPGGSLGLLGSRAVGASAASQGVSGCDVLLVEDVKVSQKIAQTALNRAQYKVEVASDGEEAIRKFEHFYSSIRIVLMDVGLPGKSGVEATVEIRERERQLRAAGALSHQVLIFGLTGNVDHDNLLLYEQAGMNGCIVKGTLLVEAVRQAVEEMARQPNKFVNLSGKQE